MRTTERLIQLGRSVNGEATDNDLMAGLSVGEHIEKLCHDMANRLEAQLEMLTKAGLTVFPDAKACPPLRRSTWDDIDADEVAAITAAVAALDGDLRVEPMKDAFNTIEGVAVIDPKTGVRYGARCRAGVNPEIVAQTLVKAAKAPVIGKI